METELDVHTQIISTGAAGNPSVNAAPQLRPRPSNGTKEELEQWKKESNAAFLHLLKTEIKNHSLPLVLILAFIACPPLLLVWVPFVLLAWGAQSIFERLNESNQKKLLRHIPEKWRNSRILAELAEGMEQVRPFIVASLYIFFAPFAITWMYLHWILRLNIAGKEPAAEISDDRVSFLQNRSQTDEEAEVNFFHSPAFSMSAIALFVSGIPAALTYFLYQHLGIDALMGLPSLDPRFKTTFVIIELYLGSIACCGSVLFFRSWFTFPLNFADNQARIELNKNGIKLKTNAWFRQAASWNSPWRGVDSMQWSQVKSLRLDRSTEPLYPLPSTVFSKNSLSHYFFNKLALVSDAIQNNKKSAQYIYFSESSIHAKQLFSEPVRGRNLAVNVSELTPHEKAQLIYSVKKWAPEVQIDDGVHKAMMGSDVLQAPAYTQLWFDLLTDKMPRRPHNVLANGTKIDKDALTIMERVATGGQANVYLAEAADGTQCVLKEFILSNSETLGALVASAAEFEMEASLLAELEHPRIIKMLRFFSEARRLYIVLEKVAGPSLRQKVRSSEARMDESEVICIALQVCDALKYLHSQTPPVVHRDISPDNLLLAPEGIKLIDFSLAAARKSMRTSSTMGKHSYAPPEQFKEQVCPQSDIYGLGATMYYLLIGEDPKPLTPADVREKRPELSDEIAEVIKRATAFELANRYTSVEWLATELRSLQEKSLVHLTGKQSEATQFN